MPFGQHLRYIYKLSVLYCRQLGLVDQRRAASLPGQPAAGASGAGAHWLRVDHLVLAEVQKTPSGQLIILCL